MNHRLLSLLGKRNLFDSEFAEAIRPLVESGDRADLLAAAAAMGEAVAQQADHLADYFDERGAVVGAGKLRAEARLLHAEWDVLNESIP